MRQSAVGDLSTAQIEPLEVSQRFQMRQPGIGDICTAEIESPEVSQRLQASPARRR